MRIEARVHPTQSSEAAHEQAGADQKHEGQGHLGHDQRAAHRGIAGVGVRPAAVLERLVRIGPREAPCGDRAREKARDQSDPEREREHGTVHAGFGDQRHLVAEKRDDRVDARPGDDEAERAAREGHERRLGQQLPDDPGPVGAERRADRDLLAAGERSGEDEVGHVRARDEQHEADRAEQHPERPPHVADEVLVERDHRRAPALVVRGIQLAPAVPRSRSSAPARRRG